MTKFGVDYVSGPGAQDLKKAGVAFVCRYLSTPGNPKNITAAEAKELHAHGIDVVLVFEQGSQNTLGGRKQGLVDAKQAHEQAVAAGAPADVVVYFAVDFDATATQQRSINAYLRAACEVLGKERVGVYGGYWPVKRALDAGVCKYAWQTYAWSGGQWDERAHLRQYANGMTLAGASVDFDNAVKDDFGQWQAPQPAPKPKPKPITVTVTGSKGGLIGKRPVTWVKKNVPALLKRFKKISLRKS